MEMKIPMVAIAAFVVITVIAAVLMPVLNDATDTEDTFTNVGLYGMKKIDNTTEATISWDHTAPGVVTVDGESFTFDNSVMRYYTLAFTDKWMLRADTNTGSQSMIVYQFDESSAGTFISATAANEADMTVTISGGTATFTVGETVKTQTVEDGMMITLGDDATYTLKNTSSTALVKGDSVMYLVGRTNAVFGGGTSCNIYGVGSIDDGYSLSYSPNTWTFSDPTDDATAKSSYKDLYEIKSVSMDASYNDQTKTITYSQFFVPIEVTAEKSIHLTSNENALLMTIPVLLVIAIIIGVLAVVMRGRE